MKKTKKMKAWVALGFVLVAGSLTTMSFMPSDGIMTREGKATVVNTTQLGKNVKGFKGNTPLKVYIEKGKIVRIETLRNQETPKFFARAKALLAQYEGKSVGKASGMKVDGVSGATYSSRALKENVSLALKYYKKHK